MFLPRRPSERQVRQFIASQKDLPFSYAEVGASRSETIHGYTVDHNRIQLGHSQANYEKAIDALRSWKHFDLGWVTIVPPESPIEVGQTVAVQARTFGLWSLNACRIVYTVDEDAKVKRFGFAYGTLPDHAECGEERFTIEWHPDDSVWYDIYAFSRPKHPLVKLGRAVARGLQKRFARESMSAMARLSK